MPYSLVVENTQAFLQGVSIAAYSAVGFGMLLIALTEDWRA